jgi:hypothetical protein
MKMRTYQNGLLGSGMDVEKSRQVIHVAVQPDEAVLLAVVITSTAGNGQDGPDVKGRYTSVSVGIRGNVRPFEPVR